MSVYQLYQVCYRYRIFNFVPCWIMGIFENFDFLNIVSVKLILTLITLLFITILMGWALVYGNLHSILSLWTSRT